MKRLFTIAILVFAALTTGCSINHPVAVDYDQHLDKYGQETVLPKSTMEADYLIDSETENHSYEFRAGSVGAAHLWIVEFGQILDKTLNADYVQSAFGRLDKSTGDNGSDSNLIVFELDSFRFEHHRAHTALNVKILSSEGEVFSRTYSAEGGSQAGQMWGAGVFGMKNATLKSTKQSIDKILSQFIDDVNTAQGDLRSEQPAGAERAESLATINVEQCEAGGGTVRGVCMSGTPACVTPYPDAGQACTDSSDCEGRCEVALGSGDPNPEPGTEATGTCSVNDDPCGCWFEVLDGKVQHGICAD